LYSTRKQKNLPSAGQAVGLLMLDACYWMLDGRTGFVGFVIVGVVNFVLGFCPFYVDEKTRLEGTKFGFGGRIAAQDAMAAGVAR
jgi:hypothetical protein